MEPADPARGLPPRFLDPVLAAVEWMDGAIHCIKPVQPDALLAIQHTRHRGAALTLADGTHVRPGDRVEVIHFRNRRLREVGATGWQSAGLRQAEQDLAVLASCLRVVPAAHRPVAFRGATVLAALARREGFEVRDRSPGLLHGMDEWYQRTLLARWSPQGRARLARGRRPLRSREVWLSAPSLLARFPGAESASEGPRETRPTLRPHPTEKEQP